MSENLLPIFKDPTVIYHPGGHGVPMASSQKKAYIQFLDDQIQSARLQKKLPNTDEDALNV